MRLKFDSLRHNDENGAGPSNRVAGNRWADPEMPEDLREWLPEPELALSVETAVHTCSTRFQNLEELGQVLLGILTYSYAIGMFLSDEIEAALTRSGQEVILGGEVRSSSRSIRQFRRYHREIVEACMFAVLSAAARSAPGGTAIATETLRDEARRRLLRAVQYDSWALDF